MDEQQWIGVVRHGQSTANVAAETAAHDRLDLIDVAEREADVPLSDLGRRQAEGLARRLRELPEGQVPDLALVSPFLRARQTAEIALGELGTRVRVDERLRDRDLGVLDLHTAQGIRTLFPEEARRRDRQGKFYYRPPGGESWTDVALRVRAVLREIEQDRPGRRVILFVHDVVVSAVRYVLEELDEESLMTTAASAPIGNASLSSWIRTGGVWRPDLFNAVDHLDDEPTAHPTAEEPADDRS